MYITDISQQVDTTANINTVNPNNHSGENICELIYHVLRVFLLRRHSIVNAEKGTERRLPGKDSFTILQPVVDILQYRGFCERVEIELKKVISALVTSGIPSTLSFTAVGEPGHHIVSLLSDLTKKSVGGEAVIRIDNWYAP